RSGAVGGVAGAVRGRRGGGVAGGGVVGGARPADGPKMAHGRVPDEAREMGEARNLLSDKVARCNFGVGGCGADHHMVCLRGETAQLCKVRNIDKMAGPREALPERRDEGLSAGQQLRFGIVAEQVLGLGEAAGPDIGCLIHRFCPPYSAAIGVRFARAASQTRCGLAGMSSRSTPSALAMALMTPADDPIAPASPQPFIPNGLVLHGVTVVLTLTDTRSLARGIA